MPDRVELADALGRPVLAFTAGAYQGRPRATAVEVLGDGAADVVLVALAGWLVNGPVGLGLELVARGARVQRHAHTLTLDLDGWSRPAVEPPAGLRFTACDRPAADLLAATWWPTPKGTSTTTARRPTSPSTSWPG